MKDSLNYIKSNKYKVVGEVLFSRINFSSNKEQIIVSEILNDSDTWYDNHWLSNRIDADAIINIRKLEKILSSSKSDKCYYFGTLLKIE